MNQPAGATRGPSTGPTATAGCCPILLHPANYYGNLFSANQPTLPPPPPPPVVGPQPTQQCLLGAQQTHLQLPPNNSISNNIMPTQPVNQPLNVLNTIEPNHGLNTSTNSAQQHQPMIHTRQEHLNFNTSSFHHLLSASRQFHNPNYNNLAMAAVCLHQQQIQAMAALLASSTLNPEFQSTFANFFTQMLANGLFRAEPQHHSNHHQQHNYHSHLHGSHHHHQHHQHHGPNVQNNGQDDTMLTMSESKPRGLSRGDIDSLTPYIQMNEKDSRTCVICLSRFELKSKIRPLPCNHVYHAKCVDKWLRANRTCPICRRDAVKTHVGKIKRI